MVGLSVIYKHTLLPSEPISVWTYELKQITVRVGNPDCPGIQCQITEASHPVRR